MKADCPSVFFDLARGRESRRENVAEITERVREGKSEQGEEDERGIWRGRVCAIITWDWPGRASPRARARARSLAPACVSCVNTFSFRSVCKSEARGGARPASINGRRQLIKNCATAWIINATINVQIPGRYGPLFPVTLSSLLDNVRRPPPGSSGEYRELLRSGTAKNSVLWKSAPLWKGTRSLSRIMIRATAPYKKELLKPNRI